MNSIQSAVTSRSRVELQLLAEVDGIDRVEDGDRGDDRGDGNASTAKRNKNNNNNNKNNNDNNNNNTDSSGCLRECPQRELEDVISAYEWVAGRYRVVAAGGLTRVGDLEGIPSRIRAMQPTGE